jgi:hypothetical protein
VKLRLSLPLIGTTLSVVGALAVTAHAMNAPRKPYKARDIVPAAQGAMLTDVCAMYPAECRRNSDGTVARVVGRRIVPGADTAVLNHFRTGIGTVNEHAFDAVAPASANTND